MTSLGQKTGASSEDDGLKKPGSTACDFWELINDVAKDLEVALNDLSPDHEIDPMTRSLVVTCQTPTDQAIKDQQQQRQSDESDRVNGKPDNNEEKGLNHHAINEQIKSTNAIINNEKSQLGDITSSSLITTTKEHTVSISSQPTSQGYHLVKISDERQARINSSKAKVRSRPSGGHEVATGGTEIGDGGRRKGPAPPPPPPKPLALQKSHRTVFKPTHQRNIDAASEEPKQISVSVLLNADTNGPQATSDRDVLGNSTDRSQDSQNFSTKPSSTSAQDQDLLLGLELESPPSPAPPHSHDSIPISSLSLNLVPTILASNPTSEQINQQKQQQDELLVDPPCIKTFAGETVAQAKIISLTPTAPTAQEPLAFLTGQLGPQPQPPPQDSYSRQLLTELGGNGSAFNKVESHSSQVNGINDQMDSRGFHSTSAGSSPEPKSSSISIDITAASGVTNDADLGDVDADDDAATSAASLDSLPAAIGLTERLMRTHNIWFLPDIGRAGVIHLLQGKEPGCFIVRKSSKPNTMALSVRLPEGRGPHVEHYLIETTANAAPNAPTKEIHLEGSENLFNSIPLLVAHYCTCCDELPVQLTLPKILMEATRAQLGSCNLLGQEFWQSALCKAPNTGSNLTSSLKSSSSESSAKSKKSAILTNDATSIASSSAAMVVESSSAAEPQGLIELARTTSPTHSPPPPPIPPKLDVTDLDPLIDTKKSSIIINQGGSASGASSSPPTSASGIPRLPPKTASGPPPIPSRVTKPSASSSTIIPSTAPPGADSPPLCSRSTVSNIYVGDETFGHPSASASSPSLLLDTTEHKSSPELKTANLVDYDRPKDVQESAIIESINDQNDDESHGNDESLKGLLPSEIASMAAAECVVVRRRQSTESALSSSPPTSSSARKNYNRSSLADKVSDYEDIWGSTMGSNVLECSKRRAKGSSNHSRSAVTQSSSSSGAKPAKPSSKDAAIHRNEEFGGDKTQSVTNDTVDVDDEDECVGEVFQRERMPLVSGACGSRLTSNFVGAKSNNLSCGNNGNSQSSHSSKVCPKNLIERQIKQRLAAGCDSDSISRFSMRSTQTSLESMEGAGAGASAHSMDPLSLSFRLSKSGFNRPVSSTSSSLYADPFDAILGPSGTLYSDHYRCPSSLRSSLVRNRSESHLYTLSRTSSASANSWTQGTFSRAPPSIAAASHSLESLLRQIKYWSQQQDGDCLHTVNRRNPELADISIQVGASFTHEGTGSQSVYGESRDKREPSWPIDSSWEYLDDDDDGKKGRVSRSLPRKKYVKPQGCGEHPPPPMANGVVHLRNDKSESAKQTAINHRRHTFAEIEAHSSNVTVDEIVQRNLMELVERGSGVPNKPDKNGGFYDNVYHQQTSGFKPVNNTVQHLSNHSSSSTVSEATRMLMHHNRTNHHPTPAHGSIITDSETEFSEPWDSNYWDRLLTQVCPKGYPTDLGSEEDDIEVEEDEEEVAAHPNPNTEDLVSKIRQSLILATSKGSVGTVTNTGTLNSTAASSAIDADNDMTEVSSLNSRTSTQDHVQTSYMDQSGTASIGTNTISSANIVGRNICSYIYRMSAEGTTTFSKAVSNFIQCTKETHEKSPKIVMSNMRQFMTGMKNYLVKHGEGELSDLIDRERNKLKADQFLNVDAIIESALHKLVIKPLKNLLYELFVAEYTKNGSLKSLADNIKAAQGLTPEQLGVRPGLKIPDPDSMSIIQQNLYKMQRAYSPLKKLEHLLSAITIIYRTCGHRQRNPSSQGSPSIDGHSTLSRQTISPATHEHHTFGADDFLPLFIYCLVSCALISAEVEADYMWGLLHPSLLAGEAGYYLTTLSSAVHVLKNLNQLDQNTSVNDEGHLENGNETAALQEHSSPGGISSAGGKSNGSSTAGGGSPSLECGSLSASSYSGPRLPVIADLQGYLKIMIPDELSNSIVSKTFPVKPQMTAREVCHMVAVKMKTSSPEDYGLFRITTEGEEIRLQDTDLPQVIKSEIITRHENNTTASGTSASSYSNMCRFAYKRIDAKFAWPTV